MQCALNKAMDISLFGTTVLVSILHKLFNGLYHILHVQEKVFANLESGFRTIDYVKLFFLYLQV